MQLQFGTKHKKSKRAKKPNKPGFTNQIKSNQWECDLSIDHAPPRRIFASVSLVNFQCKLALVRSVTPSAFAVNANEINTMHHATPAVINNDAANAHAAFLDRSRRDPVAMSFASSASSRTSTVTAPYVDDSSRIGGIFVVVVVTRAIKAIKAIESTPRPF